MAADSYVGSLISLTSKSEIRYEGILYNINPEESSIGLRDVRTFGTEGRKKDGPQIPAGDKIYEYILFRGSDIKDLVVKTDPPAKTTSVHNDPAIIQSQVSPRSYAPTSSPSVGSSSHSADSGIPGSTFPSGLPLYQPGVSTGAWAPAQPPLNASSSGLAMPMYWPGFYASSNSLPHLQQSPLLRSSPGLPIHPSTLQPFQYPGNINVGTLQSGPPNLSELPSLLPPASSAQSLTSFTLPSTVAPTTASVLAPETATTLMPNRANFLPATNIGPRPSLIPPLNTNHDPPITTLQNMPSATSNSRSVIAPTFPSQTISLSVPSGVGLSGQNQVESSVALVTPGQLMQSGPSTLPPSEPLQERHKSVEDISQVAKLKASPPASSMRVPAVEKGPLLPLPKSTYHKPNVAAMQNYNYVRPQNQHYNRGRRRGRGNWNSHLVTRFTEDFDFTAMNEKFNKDEVWGDIGKNKELSHDMEGEEVGNEAEDNQEECYAESQTLKPVYVKDDFFDTLSYNSAPNRADRSGRIKFSEQLKIDTETFGDFPRHHPARGGGRGFRGRGRARGPRNGRGYGYAGRGRGYMQ